MVLCEVMWKTTHAVLCAISMTMVFVEQGSYLGKGGGCSGALGGMCLRSITIGSVFEEPSLRAQKQRLDWVPWRAPLRKVIDTAFCQFRSREIAPGHCGPVDIAWGKGSWGASRHR